MRSKLIFISVALAMLFAQSASAQFAEEIETPALANHPLSSNGLDYNPTRLGGYAEMHYNAPEGGPRQLDFHRFVLLLEKEISHWIRFQSEVELEHALVNEGQGELELEQAFLDFTLSKELHSRAGIMLVPLGRINGNHEPNGFYGVERPDLDKHIIPSTFFAEGAGVVYKTAGWKLEGYLMAGLNAAGFAAKDGLRGGRQKGYKTDAESLSSAFRVEKSNPGLAMGVSLYQGNAKTAQVAQDAAAAGVTLDRVEVQLVAVDLDWKQGPWGLRAEAAQGIIGNSNLLNEIYGQAAPSSMGGAYLEPAYQWPLAEEQAIGIFFRLEAVNPQQGMQGGNVNAGNNFTSQRWGVNYWPHPQVAVKGDVGRKTSQLEDAEPRSELNLGLGWVF